MAADLRLKPCGHWDRLPSVDTVVKSVTFLFVDCQWYVINSVAGCTVLATNSGSSVLNLNSEVKLIEVNERQK